jgi:hypothetical protein
MGNGWLNGFRLVILGMYLEYLNVPLGLFSLIAIISDLRHRHCLFNRGAGILGL